MPDIRVMGPLPGTAPDLPPTERLPGDGASTLDSSRVILVLGIYCCLSLLVRVLIGGGLELDESEQLVLTQALRLGYGPQPPLYVWLQSSLFALLGTSILSLALLKNGLLFITYLLVYLLAEEVTEDSRAARIAVFALFLSPQYGWEFYRTLTHTVLATAAGAALILLTLRLRKRTTTAGYAALGTLVAVGTLSKYNFALLPVSLLLAGLTLRPWRSLILDRRMLLTLSVSLFLGLPHMMWAIGNADTFVSISRKLEISEASLLITYAQGFLSLAVAAVGLFWPFLIIAFLVFKPWRQPSPGNGSDASRLLDRTVLILLCVCVVIVLATRLTRFNDRWLAPLLFFLPIIAASRFRRLITGPRYRAFLGVSFATLTVFVVLLPARVFLASKTGTFTRFNLPYDVLSAKLRSSGFEGGNIYAEDHRVGGNLRLHFPESPVNVPGRPEAGLMPGRSLMLAWNAGNGNDTPPDLLAYAREHTGMALQEPLPRVVAAPVRYYRERIFRLGYWIVEPEGQPVEIPPD